MILARPLVPVLLAAAVAAAPREWVLPTGWPVERLIRNTTRYLEEHPGDPEAEYCLGRIHGLAFQLECTSLAVWPMSDPDEEDGELAESQLPMLSPHTWQVVHFGRHRRGSVEGPLPAERSLAHLQEAVRHLTRAVELSPDSARVWLGLAYVLHHGAPLADRIEALDVHGVSLQDDPEAEMITHRMRALGTSGGPAEAAEHETRDPAWLERSVPFLVRERAAPNEGRAARLLERWWLDRAIEAYWRAYSLARDADRALEEQPMEYLLPALQELVSYEAGTALRTLLAERPDARNGKRGSDVEATLGLLEALPESSIITPVLLTLDGCPTLEDLDTFVERDADVPFDLNGDGRVERWPWLRPGTGWLVWDPERSGRITSGRQLFGSASGWFFFPDGYRVLDALDDDRDGRLRGAELDGIAVWFDRDSDGVSDPGEVTPVQWLGIAALATEATTKVDASPANPCGVELTDGRVLPTWDWVLRASGPADGATNVATTRLPLAQTLP
jgi:hypothetical protein